MAVGMGPTSKSSSNNQPLLSWPKLIALTICFLGVQFAWSVQIARTTPLFLELGLPDFWVSFVWAAGPISGLIVQPLVGTLSDGMNTRYGRRRPFIFFGTVAALIGEALISNAVDLGRGLGDEGSGHSRAIVLAIIGFWIMDLSINTVQGPCRALLVDVAPDEQQSLGSSIFSFMLGMGNLIGYLIGSVDLMNSGLGFFGSEIRALFSISMILFATCIAITLVSIVEPPNPSAGPTENPFKKILLGLYKMPPIVRRVCLVQFFVWFGWFTYLIYTTSWMGVNIFHGDPHAPEGSDDLAKYQAGVRYGSLALTYNAAVTMVASAALPKLLTLGGIKIIYFIGNLFLGLCLCSTIFIHTKELATAAIALFGIPWSVTMVVPYTIISQGVNASESGLYLGALNIFVVLPQLLVSVSIGAIINAFNNNYAAALVAGGFGAFIGAATVFFIIVKAPEVKDVTSGLLDPTSATTPLLDSDSINSDMSETDYTKLSVRRDEV